MRAGALFQERIAQLERENQTLRARVRLLEHTVRQRQAEHASQFDGTLEDQTLIAGALYRQREHEKLPDWIRRAP